MNLIGSVAQRLQQKENKVSLLIRTAALLAGIRATGKMNNLSRSNPQRSATKSSKPFTFWGWPTKFLGHRTRFFIWSPATAHPVEARPRRDNCRSAQLAAPLTPSLHYLKEKGIGKHDSLCRSGPA
jgi:hypothetical protein